MAVMGLHVFLQRGPNELQREMFQKTSMEINSIKTANNLMETIPTHKIRLLLSIIQMCTLNPIPVFNPTSENSDSIGTLYSRSAQTGLIEALLLYFATKKLRE